MYDRATFAIDWNKRAVTDRAYKRTWPAGQSASDYRDDSENSEQTSGSSNLGLEMPRFVQFPNFFVALLREGDLADRGWLLPVTTDSTVSPFPFLKSLLWIVPYSIRSKVEP